MNIERPFATKTDWVYSRLRAEILEGTLKPDDRLRLSLLARRFETSRLTWASSAIRICRRR